MIFRGIHIKTHKWLVGADCNAINTRNLAISLIMLSPSCETARWTSLSVGRERNYTQPATTAPSNNTPTHNGIAHETINVPANRQNGNI
jgi:hypothetical protein